MLLKMSISSSILIILIAVLRLAAINRLPKKVFVLLWDIAILRLLVPFDLPIHYGLASPVAKIANSSISQYHPANSSTIISPKRPIIDTITSSLSGITWTKIVWATGMVVFLVVFGTLYRKEYQRIRTALPVSKEHDNYFRSKVTIPNHVKLLTSDRISTPLTYGVLSPKIILPKIYKLSDSTKIKYILTHELIHIKRLDNLWKIIILTAVSVHWFNPFVWIMYSFFNRDIELSCDERVVALLGESAKKEYAMTLADLAEKQYLWSSISNGFGKNAIQERIMAIMKFKKATCINIGCTAVLLAGAVTVFASFKVADNNLGITPKNHIADDKKNYFEKAENADDEYVQHGITVILLPRCTHPYFHGFKGKQIF